MCDYKYNITYIYNISYYYTPATMQGLRLCFEPQAEAPSLARSQWTGGPNYGDHTNPSHPRHAPFNTFKFGYNKFKHLLNTQH